MRYLPVTIQDKIAEYMSSEKMICYNSDYILQFTFDAEWDSYTQKTAQIRYFSTNKGWVKHDIIFTGMECNVPVIPNASVVYVGVYAGDIRTTTEAEISCRPSVLSYDGAPVNPPDDVYNQIMQKLNEIEQSGATPEQIAAAIEKYLTENPITAADVNAVAQNQGVENAGKFLGINESGDVVPVESGADGITPHIGANGNWYIGETDTGVKADASGDYIPLPQTAAVGQYFRVSAVDENGVVTAVEAVDAPSGGGETTDISLGITGAAVGQTVRITAVDDAGIPKAWEAVDMTSGSGDNWKLLVDFESTEEIAANTGMVFDTADDGTPINAKEIIIDWYCPAAGGAAYATFKVNNVKCTGYAHSALYYFWSGGLLNTVNIVAALHFRALSDVCLLTGGKANVSFEPVWFAENGAFDTITSLQLTMFGGTYPVGLKIKILGR